VHVPRRQRGEELARSAARCHHPGIPSPQRRHREQQPSPSQQIRQLIDRLRHRSIRSLPVAVQTQFQGRDVMMQTKGRGICLPPAVQRRHVLAQLRCMRIVPDVHEVEGVSQVKVRVWRAQIRHARMRARQCAPQRLSSVSLTQRALQHDVEGAAADRRLARRCIKVDGHRLEPMVLQCVAQRFDPRKGQLSSFSNKSHFFRQQQGRRV